MGTTGENDRAATLHDVAARVGVSPRTVSRVVNDEGGFSDATRRRVLDAVAELDYRPNVFARGLISGRSRTLAFVVPVLSDPFFPEVAQGVQRAARDRGLTMLFALNERDPRVEVDLLSQLAAFAPQGAIVYPATPDTSHLVPVAERGMRIVVVDAEIDHPNTAVLSSDLGAGAALAARHLHRRGARRMAMLAYEQATADEARESGFRAAVAELGLDAPVVVRVDATHDGGRHAMAEVIERCPDVDGVFAFNDVMAIGALESIHASGRAVPGDVAVVGCDDIELSAVVRPALTTVRIDRERVGAEAVGVLAALVEHPESRESRRVLPVDLIVRDSA